MRRSRPRSPARCRRLHRDDGLERARQPDRAALRARRPRVRRQQERDRQRLRRPRRHDADAVRRPARRVHDFWDRGLLGLALDPGFASGRPYVYVLYAYDGAELARAGWGDGCPSPPGATADGCVASGRLSRLQRRRRRDGADRGLLPAVPEPLARDDRLRPRRDAVRERRRRRVVHLRRLRPGRQPGQPVRRPGRSRAARCARRASAAPAATAGDARRRDPARGPGHRRRRARATRRSATPNPGRRRIVAYGLRNPFRFTFRPGTGEIWSGDVGWNTDEEINRTPDLDAGPQLRLAVLRGRGADGRLRLAEPDQLRDALQRGARATAPYFSYRHSEKVVAGESCTTGSSSISGLAFYTGDAFGPAYKDALFFSDYSRNCIWVMYQGAERAPGPGDAADVPGRRRRPRVPHRRGPTARSTTPTSRAGRSAGSRPTTARRRRASPPTPTSGAAPLTVAFDGAARATRSGQPLTYAWDLDGDGAYDDSTAAAPSFTYPTPGVVTVRLRVSDPGGLHGDGDDHDHRRRPADGRRSRARPPTPRGRSATRSRSPAPRARAPAPRCRRRGCAGR